jgi:hypothetical protein
LRGSVRDVSPQVVIAIVHGDLWAKPVREGRNGWINFEKIFKLSQAVLMSSGLKKFVGFEEVLQAIDSESMPRASLLPTKNEGCPEVNVDWCATANEPYHTVELGLQGDPRAHVG